MGWLRKETRLEPGTHRWKELHDCFRGIATDMWKYLKAIDRDEWDVEEVQRKVAAVETGIQLAERIWPEGRRVLKRLAKWFGESTRVREQEHWLVLNPIVIDFDNPIRQNMRRALWRREMAQVLDGLGRTGKGMLECSNEIKKLTAIDLRECLQTGVISDAPPIG